MILRDLPAKARINNVSRVRIWKTGSTPLFKIFLKVSGIQVGLKWIYGILALRSINLGLS